MAINAAIGIAGALLPSLLGGLSGGSSANSGLDSYKYSRWLQEHQYELNRKTRQTSFQDTRYDLEQAGYNPLLAVGQQSNGGTFGATLNTQDPKSERLQNLLSSIQTASGVHLNSSQAVLNNRNGLATIQNALNNTNQTNANIGLINQQAIGQGIQNNIQSAYGMANMYHTIQNLIAQTGNYKAQSALAHAQIPVAKALSSVYTNTAHLVNAQTQGQLNNNVVSARHAQWINNHPILSGFGLGMQQVGVPTGQTVAPLVGAGAGIYGAAQLGRGASAISNIQKVNWNPVTSKYIIHP